MTFHQYLPASDSQNRTSLKKEEEVPSAVIPCLIATLAVC